MIRNLLLALALVAGVSSFAPSAQAQVFVVASCAATGLTLPLGAAGRFVQSPDGTLCTTAGSGGGGSSSPTGSVTAPGTNGTVAQAVQGINGGVPLNGYTGQYNTTLPTFANGQAGYAALDVNGRQILSPTVTLPISAASLPLPTGAATAALQSSVQSAAGTSAGTLLTVQGSSTGVAIPVSGTFFQATQPVSSTTLATAANQNSTAAGTSATNAQGVQGVTGGVPLAIQGGNATAVKTDGSATTQPVSAANLPLPAGAATSANQTNEITQLTTANQRSTWNSEFLKAAIGASATSFGTVRDGGAAPSTWNKVNVYAVSDQPGQVYLIGSDSSAMTNNTIIVLQSITANVPFQISINQMYRYYQAYIVNGTTASTASTLRTGFSVN